MQPSPLSSSGTFSLGNDLNKTPICEQPKKKFDKLDFLIIKKFCASKNTIKRVKSQLTEYDKIFQIEYLIRVE